nr:coiled-coil domain-containing protein 69 isoform X1 [Anser cygnoides]
MGCTGSALRCCPAGGKRQLKAQQRPASQELTALKTENANATLQHGAGQEKAAPRDKQGTEAAQLLRGHEEEEERLRGAPGTEAEGPRGASTQVEKGKDVELKEQLLERFDALRREHEETLQELRRAHEQEKLLLAESHHRSQEALQETVEALRSQLKSFQERMKRVEESLLSRDYKKHIEEHGSPSPFWEQELESLHFVIEMKNEHIHGLDKKLLNLETVAERNLLLEEKVKTLQQENEDLQVRTQNHLVMTSAAVCPQAALRGAAGRPRGAGEGVAAAGAGSPREGGAAVPRAQRGGRLPLPHRRWRRAPHCHVAPTTGWPGSPPGTGPGDAVTSASAPGAGPRGGRVPAVAPCTGRWSTSWDAHACLSPACALPVLQGGPAPCRARTPSSGVRPWGFWGVKGAGQGTRTYIGLDPTPRLAPSTPSTSAGGGTGTGGAVPREPRAVPIHGAGLPPRPPLPAASSSSVPQPHGSGTSPLTATPKPSPPCPRCPPAGPITPPEAGQRLRARRCTAGEQSVLPHGGNTSGTAVGSRHTGGTRVRAGCTRALSPGKSGPSPGPCSRRACVCVCWCACVRAPGPCATGCNDYESTRSSSLKNPASVVFGDLGVSGSIVRQGPVFRS